MRLKRHIPFTHPRSDRWNKMRRGEWNNLRRPIPPRPTENQHGDNITETTSDQTTTTNENTEDLTNNNNESEDIQSTDNSHTNDSETAEHLVDSIDTIVIRLLNNDIMPSLIKTVQAFKDAKAELRKLTAGIDKIYEEFGVEDPDIVI